MSARLSVQVQGQSKALVNRLAKVPSRAAPRAAKSIRKLITKEFTTGTNPYGAPWAPLRPATLAKGRRPPPLRDTGAMSRGIRVFPTQGSGIGVTVPFPGHFHQGGTRRMAARPILPTGTLPKAWTAAIRKAYEDSLK